MPHAPRFTTSAVRLLLAALMIAAMPVTTHAQSVPASFDCAKAERSVDRFICAQAVLRWQDLAMSRLYAAAKAAVTGPARDDLVLAQRDWLRERDRRCIADRSFDELNAVAALHEQAYACLDVVYLGRRRSLQDLAQPPWTPTRIAPVDLKAIAAARPELVDENELLVADMQASPDGSLLAILLPNQEIDLPDQVWLYRVADRQLVPATPPPQAGAPAAIQALIWQDDTLYTRVSMPNPDGDSEAGIISVHAATMAGQRRLDTVPGDIARRLDAAASAGKVDASEMADRDADLREAARGNRDFLVWPRDLGHGTLELDMRPRRAGAPAYLVAWGSWELRAYRFDAERSQLLYPADTGITIFDLKTRSERRIAGTARGDRPYALSADQRLLVWATRQTCGDESLNEPDERAPLRFCLAQLPAPARNP
jgi:uncharacterized protein YecT (DUF1311 family)